ncbi:hypothetical protein NQ314_014355 [Rhamnusium bicolor]|uniref:Uncharacterized protein n=1 Tax=Rhamnusium bicolor TaxID=1586634 RepID=A0AAV8X1S6_9CUCU|nr:hypothetical protein NQ314_014355 [Rhamnusium bicolor]
MHKSEILNAFSTTDNGEETARWTNRGYLMTQGVLYRYDQDRNEDNAQLVIPVQERSDILKSYHDAQQLNITKSRGHYGAFPLGIIGPA